MSCQILAPTPGPQTPQGRHSPPTPSDGGSWRVLLPQPPLPLPFAPNATRAWHSSNDVSGPIPVSFLRGSDKVLLLLLLLLLHGLSPLPTHACCVPPCCLGGGACGVPCASPSCLEAAGPRPNARPVGSGCVYFSREHWRLRHATSLWELRLGPYSVGRRGEARSARVAPGTRGGAPHGFPRVGVRPAPPGLAVLPSPDARRGARAGSRSLARRRSPPTPPHPLAQQAPPSSCLRRPVCGAGRDGLPPVHMPAQQCPVQRGLRWVQAGMLLGASTGGAGTTSRPLWITCARCGRAPGVHPHHSLTAPRLLRVLCSVRRRPRTALLAAGLVPAGASFHHASSQGGNARRRRRGRNRGAKD